MKILQHAPKRNSYQKVCTISCACGCRFEFGPDDPLIEHQLDKWDRTYSFIKCPECGNKFHLKPSFFYKVD
jgi:hypothetical protein